MKKINYILLLLCCMFSIQPYFAQLPVVIEGELARIEYGTDVIIQGDYTHRDLYDAIGDTTYGYTFWNFSKLYITGDITNESELTDVFEPMLLRDFRAEGFDLADDLKRLDSLGIDISKATTQEQQYALLDEFYNDLGKVILNHPTDSQYVKGKVYVANLDIIKNDGDKVIVKFI